ncbi:hypothetical protein ACRRTK_012071 [Alexandromys fortis]
MTGPCCRVNKETVSVAESGPGVEVEPVENNLCYFHVVSAGPQDSPLEGGTYRRIPNGYN